MIKVRGSRIKTQFNDQGSLCLDKSPQHKSPQHHANHWFRALDRVSRRIKDQGSRIKDQGSSFTVHDQGSRIEVQDVTMLKGLSVWKIAKKHHEEHWFSALITRSRIKDQGSRWNSTLATMGGKLVKIRVISPFSRCPRSPQKSPKTM